MDTYKAVVDWPLQVDSARDKRRARLRARPRAAAGNAGVESSILVASFGGSPVQGPLWLVIYRFSAQVTRQPQPERQSWTASECDQLFQRRDPYSDIVSMAFLSAIENSVFVSCSAGRPVRVPIRWAPGAMGNHGGSQHTASDLSRAMRTFTDDGRYPQSGGRVDWRQHSGQTGDWRGLWRHPLGSRQMGQPVSATSNLHRGPESIILPTQHARLAWKRRPTFRQVSAKRSYYNPAVQTLNANNHFIPTVHIDDVSG